MKRIARIILAALVLTGCVRHNQVEPTLRERLCEVVSQAPGTVGVAFVDENDTILINNGVRYPMMSVFKMHQALAVAGEFGRCGTSLDTILRVNASELDRDTWSPMLKVYGDSSAISISVAELMSRSVVESDNNASNLLFSRVMSPQAVDSCVRQMAEDTTFAIEYTENDMKRAHDLSYSNYTSPLSAALLIRRIFREELMAGAYQDSVRQMLGRVTTGADRLCSPLADDDGVQFAHKTGSGYRNGRGELTAFNDVAYVRLPDGRDYTLAVLIRDFAGTEAEAAAVMARISTIVFHHLDN